MTGVYVDTVRQPVPARRLVTFDRPTFRSGMSKKPILSVITVLVVEYSSDMSEYRGCF